MCFAVYLSLTKGCMVRTRLRATSPGHQESRDGSSNLHRDQQSALVTQLPSIQHVQSMAVAMVELTRQNQELTREISLRRQRHERNTKDKPRVKKIEEEMLSPKASQGEPLHEGCHTLRGIWIR